MPGQAPGPARRPQLDRTDRSRASSFSVTGPATSTTISVSRSTGCWSAGPFPKGLTLDPAIRRGAFRVEDHPIEYFDFEGVIPAGQYGAGDVIVWDWGTYRAELTDDARRALDSGELKLRADGATLRGRFTIVRTRGGGAILERRRRLGRTLRAGGMAPDQETGRGRSLRLGHRLAPPLRQVGENERRGRGRNAARLRRARADRGDARGSEG